MAQEPGIELDETLDFQRREWRVQRVGRWLLGGFVVAAALGLFGGGWLSQAQTRDPQGTIWIDYQRFVRADSPTRVSVSFRRAAIASADTLDLHVSRRYFDAVRIDRITPTPASTIIGADRVTFAFPRPPASADVQSVVFDLSATAVGWLTADFAVGNAAALRAAQIVYF